MGVLTGVAAPRGMLRYQLDSGVGRLALAERAARGKQARAAVPRDSHAVFDPGPARPARPAGRAGEGAGAARPGDRIPIAAYLGDSDVFDNAITRFAAACANQNERDYDSLVGVVACGRITAERDL